MLVDPKFLVKDPMLLAILRATGGDPKPQRIDQGLYLANHWNVGDMATDIRERWKEEPYVGIEAPFEEYGVCDDLKQPVEQFNLKERPEKVFVSFVEIRQVDQPSDGGWRWHKWGPYIGEHKPQHEYLYYEKDIDRVFTFHIYEVY